MRAQSEAARLYKFKYVLTRWDMKLTVRSACGTLHCQWCAGLRCDKLQELHVLFSKEFWLRDCVYYIFIMPRKFLNHPDIQLLVWSHDLQISEAKFYPAHYKML